MRLPLLLIVALSCAPKNVRDITGLGPPPVQRVAITEPVVLADLWQPVDDMASFRQGTWVGSIWFGGGFDILDEEQHQVRSLDVSLEDHDAYREQALAWLRRTAEDAAREVGWQVVSAGISADRVSGTPERHELRGTTPFDGEDNVNLPRYDLIPVAVAPGEAVDEVDAVLVPTLVHYYAHNAGWFVGQHRGTWAGARIRLLWSLHAGAGGALIGWGEIGTRNERQQLASPNRQELQDLLLEAEAEARARWVRQLAATGSSR